ncbi:MAG: hypothetical protein ACOVNR_01020, partial [Chitinophagaceae bacterium]
MFTNNYLPDDGESYQQVNHILPIPADAILLMNSHQQLYFANEEAKKIFHLPQNVKDWSAISFLSIVEKKLQLPAIANALNSALATNTNQQINWINPHTNNLYSVYFNVFDNGICIQCTNI